MDAIRNNPVLVAHGLAVVVVLAVLFATGNADNVPVLLAALLGANGPAGVIARQLVTPTRKLPEEAPQ